MYIPIPHIKKIFSLLCLVLPLICLIISGSALAGPICGNNVCDDGEQDGCPSCTKLAFPCELPCDASMICPADCGVPSVNYPEMTFDLSSGVFCEKTDPSIIPSCAQFDASSAQYVWHRPDGTIFHYVFSSKLFSNISMTLVDGRVIPIEVTLELKKISETSYQIVPIDDPDKIMVTMHCDGPVCGLEKSDHGFCELYPQYCAWCGPPEEDTTSCPEITCSADVWTTETTEYGVIMSQPDKCQNFYTLSQESAGVDNRVKVSKYDPCGERIWARYFGAPDSRSVYHLNIEADKSGDIFIVLSDTAWSPVEPPRRHLILKIDPDGEPIWARTIDLGYINTGDDPWGGYGHDIAVGPSGSLYVIASMGEPVDLWVTSPWRIWKIMPDGSFAEPPWPIYGFFPPLDEPYFGGGWSVPRHHFSIAIDPYETIYSTSWRYHERVSLEPENITVFASHKPDGFPSPAFGDGGTLYVEDVRIGASTISNCRLLAARATGGGPADLYNDFTQTEGPGTFMALSPFSGDVFVSTDLNPTDEWEVREMATDSMGNVYVVGGTRWTWLGFVKKFSPDYELLWIDYSDDVLIDLSIGPDDSVYVSGGGSFYSDEHSVIRKYTPDGFSDDGPPDFIAP